MTLSTQFITMLTMVGMGSFFGASLDTYNRFLKRGRRNNWIIFFNDLLFWLFQALIIFYVLFLVNEGELRFYLFIALLCGFAAYQSLLKRPFSKILEFFISTIISIWGFVVRLFLMIIYRPILSLAALIISVILMIGKWLFKLLKLIGIILLWIGKRLFILIKLILLLFWKLMPKGIKKLVEKLYNRIAGFLWKIKKYWSKLRGKWNWKKK